MIAKILESIHIEFELRGKKNIIIEEIFKIFGIGEKYLSRRKGKKEKYSEKKKQKMQTIFSKYSKCLEKEKEEEISDEEWEKEEKEIR